MNLAMAWITCAVHIPSRELTYPTLGKGNSPTQNCLGIRDLLVPLEGRILVTFWGPAHPPPSAVNYPCPGRVNSLMVSALPNCCFWTSTRWCFFWGSAYCRRSLRFFGGFWRLTDSHKSSQKRLFFHFCKHSHGFKKTECRISISRRLSLVGDDTSTHNSPFLESLELCSCWQSSPHGEDVSIFQLSQ